MTFSGFLLFDIKLISIKGGTLLVSQVRDLGKMVFIAVIATVAFYPFFLFFSLLIDYLQGSKLAWLALSFESKSLLLKQFLYDWLSSIPVSFTLVLITFFLDISSTVIQKMLLWLMVMGVVVFLFILFGGSQYYFLSVFLAAFFTQMFFMKAIGLFIGRSAQG